MLYISSFYWVIPCQNSFASSKFSVKRGGALLLGSVPLLGIIRYIMYVLDLKEMTMIYFVFETSKVFSFVFYSI